MSSKPSLRRTQAERTEASDKAIFRAAIKLIAKVQPALADKSVLIDLKTLAKLYLESVRSESDLILALFRLMNDSYSSHKELKKQFAEFDNQARGLMVNLIEKGRAAGEIRESIDPHGFSVLYIGMLRGTAIQYFISKKNVDLDLAQTMIADLVDTLGTG